MQKSETIAQIYAKYIELITLAILYVQKSTLLYMLHIVLHILNIKSFEVKYATI